MNTIRVSNNLDKDQAQRFVEPDLDPNCLQRLSAEDITDKELNNIRMYRPVTMLFITCINTVLFNNKQFL